MTQNKEDYLKAIYEAGGENNLVSNKTLADKLGVAPASVTEMLNKMKKQNLIYYEAYKGSRLTEDGLQYCLTVVRRHRLWEVFLIRHLGYSWSEAHEDAHLLEHTSSRRMVDRLDQFLNYPAYCPHGSEIPGGGRVHSDHPEILLSSMQEGDVGMIRRVTEEKDLLDYLEEKQIKIGSEIMITGIEKYEGPINLRCKNRDIQISYKAAEKIYAEISVCPNRIKNK